MPEHAWRPPTKVARAQPLGPRVRRSELSWVTLINHKQQKPELGVRESELLPDPRSVWFLDRRKAWSKVQVFLLFQEGLNPWEGFQSTSVWSCTQLRNTFNFSTILLSMSFVFLRRKTEEASKELCEPKFCFLDKTAFKIYCCIAVTNSRQVKDQSLIRKQFPAPHTSVGMPTPKVNTILFHSTVYFKKLNTIYFNIFFPLPYPPILPTTQLYAISVTKNT